MTELTEQQASFANHYVLLGGDGAAAARAAGYAEDSARQAAYRLTRLPHVEAAIRAEQRRLLGGKLASKAITVLEAILDDEKAPYGARVDAAKTLLDRGGLIAPKASDPDSPDEGKPMDRMTEAELEALVRRLEAKEGLKSHAESMA